MSPEPDCRRAIIVVAVAYPELARILINWEISQGVFKKRPNARPSGYQNLPDSVIFEKF
jgi:hypothetical protein